jgi:hypothetical protein
MISVKENAPYEKAGRFSHSPWTLAPCFICNALCEILFGVIDDPVDDRRGGTRDDGDGDVSPKPVRRRKACTGNSKPATKALYLAQPHNAALWAAWR